MNGMRRLVAVSRFGVALVVLGGVMAVGATLIDAAPAGAATTPTWASGPYFGTMKNVPFCYGIAVSGGTPLTSMSAGAVPANFTNYTLQNVNLNAGTAQLCGIDTNNTSSTTTTFAPTATNSAGTGTASFVDAHYGPCTWTSSTGAEKTFDANQDLDQTGSQTAFGAPITNGETAGTTSNYTTCTNAYVPGLGAFTVNTANPMPTPTDTNPSADQGDLPSSNLELNKGCFGAVEFGATKNYSFGSGTALTVPSPWVNGGSCSYGGLGSNSAGGNTDSFATCPPTQADVNAGLVDCSITASSGTQSGSFNYSTDELFFTGQPVPQASTATLGAASAPIGGSVSVTGGTNWWGNSGGAPNTGPYGDTQSGAFYQVNAPSIYIGLTRGSAVQATSSTVSISPDTYVCSGAETNTDPPNPCVFTPGAPSGSFTVPAGLTPGVTYNVYIDETNTTPLPGNGPNDAYQTARATNLGTAEAVTTLQVGQPPAFTSSAATTFASGASSSFTVQTTGSPTPAIVESGALPSGVTFTDNGNGTATLAGTTTQTGTYPISFTATNGVGSPATQSFTLTVNATAAITSAASTTFTTGSAGSFTVQTTGSPTPSISKSGALPSGVTFTDNGNGTATLAGTPANGTGGTYPLTITATNGVGSPATQSFTLTVHQAPAITSGSSTTITENVPSSFTVISTGFPTPSVTEVGALPSGITFVDNGDGTATLAGTADPGTAGTYPLAITASNGVGSDATQSFTLTVSAFTAPPSITSGDATTFTTGSAGSFTVQTTGAPTPSLSETGTLPSGVSFVDVGDGTASLSGTPAAGTGGVYHLTITASNGVGSDATQSFTLTVDQAPAITSVASKTMTTNVAGSFTVTSTGFPTPALSESGALPSGVTFTDNGDGTASLAGTPGPGTSGTYPLTLTASNGVGSDATQSFTLTVKSPPAITSGASTTFTEQTADSFTVTSTGSPTPALSESGALPSGVTFTDNGDGTASLAGTPAAGTSGTYPLTITADNGVGSDATQSFTLTVNAAPAITSASSTTFTVSVAGSFTVTSSGSPTPALSESGALPSGVTFTDNGDGTATLAGTPANGTDGTYPLTLTASNGVGSDATQSFTLTVNPFASAPSITSAASTTFTTGTAGSFTVQSTGTPTPSLSETGSLPSGVSFVDNGDGTASLSGTPGAGTGGTYPLTVTASNGVGSDATQSFTLTVDDAPAFTSGTSATFAVGTAGSFTITTTGFPAPTISEAGTLPTGVHFTNNGDGTATVAGTPANGTGGSYFLTMAAHNGVGSNASQGVTLTVGPHTPPATFTGQISCTATGKVNFSPVLTPTSASHITFTLSDAKCKGLNGTAKKQGGSKLTKGGAVFTLPTGQSPGTYNCSAVFGQLSTPPAISYSNFWTSTGPGIVASGISFPQGTVTSVSKGIVLSYTGGTVTSGSFANGGAGVASLQLEVSNKSISKLTQDCQGAGSHGFKLSAPATANLVVGS
jgi:hypothetical protein